MMARIASCRRPPCVRWHSSTKTNLFRPLASNPDGYFAFRIFCSSSRYFSKGSCALSSPSTSSPVTGSICLPNLCISEQISHSEPFWSVSSKSSELFALCMLSWAPKKVLLICMSSSVRSVMTSTLASLKFLLIYLASHTIVRLLPDP